MCTRVCVSVSVCVREGEGEAAYQRLQVQPLLPPISLDPELVILVFFSFLLQDERSMFPYQSSLWLWHTSFGTL